MGSLLVIVLLFLLIGVFLFVWLRKTGGTPVFPVPHLHQKYFAGLNHLINEEPDQALDVFLELVKIDGDTVDMHLALGSLFRRRGEVDRATRIHQNLIARPDLPRDYRIQVLFALGQDYNRAGVLDRAERLFLELLQLKPRHEKAQLCLLDIYQQEKDWLKAIDLAQKLSIIRGKPSQYVVAQYFCQLVDQAWEAARFDQVQRYIKKALSADPHCVRAHILRADLACHLKVYQEAIHSYKRILMDTVDYFPVIAPSLRRCHEALGTVKEMMDFLQVCVKRRQDPAFIAMIAEYLYDTKGADSAIEFITPYVERSPSIETLYAFIVFQGERSVSEARQPLETIRKYVKVMLDKHSDYRCQHCGFSTKSLFWSCPACHYWDSFKSVVEESLIN